MMNIDDKLLDVLVQKSESTVVANSGTFVSHSSEVSPVQILPDEIESKPDLTWLPGLEPDHTTMDRITYLTELSKTLKNKCYV